MEAALRGRHPPDGGRVAPRPHRRPRSGDPGARRRRCCGCTSRAREPEPVGRAFSDAAIQLALASYPGFSVTRPPAAGTPYGIYRAAYVPQADVPHRVVHARRHPHRHRTPARRVAQSRRLAVSKPRICATRGAVCATRRVGWRDGPRSAGSAGATRAPATRAATPTSASGSRPIIRAATTPTPGSSAFLDEPTVRDLLPEAATLDLEIHPLPNLAAVNIVIHGLLGEGVASSTRLDPQAKGLGEWLRARDCAIPSILLPEPVLEASL